MNHELKNYLPKIADYLVLASQIKLESPPAEYHRANVLALELAMVLPADLYRSIGCALSRHTADHNIFTVAIEVRRLVMGDNAGNLTADNCIGHAPGIGRKDKL